MLGGCPLPLFLRKVFGGWGLGVDFSRKICKKSHFHLWGLQSLQPLGIARSGK
jgi:hypothetical protein